jgi:hypothetical protein
MPITFQCQCGRKFRTSDENAGRSATCPDCRARFVVPAASAVPAAAPAAAPPRAPVKEAPAPPPLPAAYPAESEEVTPVARRPAAPSSPYGWSELDDPGDPEEPRRRRRRPERDDDIRNRIVRRPASPSSSFAGAGVLAGIGMMAVAVIWFFGCGLMFDVWFIYPPFLFIAGLVCLIRGVAAAKM